MLRSVELGFSISGTPPAATTSITINIDLQGLIIGKLF